ncbi:MAG: hypothetical protein EKK39_10765 [Sphingobacteriales bacterium]|uniref:ArnT family glycosyltransferase n=1 Tax=Hydrotalea flava TaxID=714549 RepID=UPI00083070F7|nr:glycosyltransferase family 39 protein [Hydrotalea flava]RTL49377.1 MAG: hypothetical protein EKK39_10765 [Sphingobacteriales bacterium]
MDRKKIYLLLLIWFLINLIQGLVTNIQEDETYYFLYSKSIDWGYFDHPPFIAWMIRAGSLFFKGNLQIRFFPIVLQPFTLLLIWEQLNFKRRATTQQILLFFLTTFSMIMFSVYGFVATPDSPLLFFTALFFFSYQRFLKKSNWINTLLMIVSSVGLIYSKYQGVLVIFLSLLSNTSLFKKKQFYLVLLIGLLLLAPHIYWQYSHHFPSIKFHAIGRSEPFKWAYFWEYIPNQMLSFNPFIFLAVIYVLVKYKYIDAFHKALYFNIIGIILFFWVSTFRGHAEPHWTIVAAVPMLIVLNEHISYHPALLKYTKRFIGASAILVLLLRIALAAQLLPEQFGFSSKSDYYKAIAAEANHIPVIFLGNHIEPSLYHFYTGDTAISLSNLNTRKSQFDIWNYQNNWMGKPAFIFGDFKGKSNHYNVNGYKFNGFKTDSLFTTNSLKITYQLPTDILYNNDSVLIPFQLKNTLNKTFFLQTKDFTVEINAILKNKTSILVVPCRKKLRNQFILPGATIQDTLHLIMPKLSTGQYLIGLAASNTLGPTANSSFTSIEIK